MPCRFARSFKDVWTPYFHTRSVFLWFCAGSRPVDYLAGAVLAPTGQMAHNQVLPGKNNMKMPSRASSGPVRPGSTDYMGKPIDGIWTCPHSDPIHNRISKLIWNPQEPVLCPHMNLMEPFRVRIRHLAILWPKNMQRTQKTPVCM